jgi:hypothetical protein
VIGENEASKTRSFKDRVNEQKAIPYSGCGNGTITTRYQWADYKTSLLCQEINNNTIVNFDQQLFIQRMIMNILVTLKADVHVVLNKYMEDLETEEQKQQSRSYPVCQSQQWRGDPQGVWNNMYGLINFLKWIWYKLYLREFYDTNDCDASSLGYYVLIETIQQMIFKVQSNIKGSRRNDKSDIKTNNVGISDIISDDVIRRNDNNIQVEPWIHPGKSQCFVPYFGGYGAEIKKYREDAGNNKFSSLKCGISGSVNYFIFLYLLSTIVSKDKVLTYNPKRLIILLTSILAGDGGHNIREITFGVASAVIVLKNLINDIKIELQTQYGNISFEQAVNTLKTTQEFGWISTTSIIGNLKLRMEQNIGDKLNNCSNITTTRENIINEMLVLMLESFSKWEEPVIELYNLSADMNVVGIDYQDISNTSGVDIRSPEFNYDALFNYTKLKTYEVLFGLEQYTIDKRTKKVYNIHLANSVQLFYALENNRYRYDKQDSFKKASDESMKHILNTLYPTLYDTVNNKALAYLTKCNDGRRIPFTYIPFA